MQKLMLIGVLIISCHAWAQNENVVINNQEKIPGPLKNSPVYVVQKANRQGPDTFTYKGNLFENSPHAIDTVTVIDPETGRETVVLSPVNVYPTRMNNDTIYNMDTDTGMIKKTMKEILLSITNAMRPQLEKLNDGGYILQVKRMVIDNKGKLVYSDHKEIDARPYFIDAELKDEIEKRLSELFDAQQNWPVYKINNKPAQYLVNYSQVVYVYKHHMRL